MSDLPAEAVQAAANAALAARIAREAFTGVQGPVKGCLQEAPESTESAEPASRVPSVAGTSKAISEPRGGVAIASGDAEVIEAAIAENYDGTPVNPSPAHSSRLHAAGAAA